MNIWQSIRAWLNSHNFLPSSQQSLAKRPPSGLHLPEGGRSSIEGGRLANRFGSALAFWDGVSPVIDFEMLSLLN